MSSGFLTVEDINTLDINTVVNEYFVVDTSLIGTDEFSEVQYDFVKVSHFVSGGNHHFRFDFAVELYGVFRFRFDKRSLVYHGIVLF